MAVAVVVLVLLEELQPLVHLLVVMEVILQTVLLVQHQDVMEHQVQQVAQDILLVVELVDLDQELQIQKLVVLVVVGIMFIPVHQVVMQQQQELTLAVAVDQYIQERVELEVLELL
jgi:hypothetical protein